VSIYETFGLQGTGHKSELRCLFFKRHDGGHGFFRCLVKLAGQLRLGTDTIVAFDLFDHGRRTAVEIGVLGHQALVMWLGVEYGTLAVNPFTQVAQVILAHVFALELLGAGAIDKSGQPDFPFNMRQDCIVEIHSNPLII